MDAQLGRAFAVAYAKHRTQKDKAGQPYILHLVRVMIMCQTREQKVVAMLHDIVEDTDVSLEWIQSFFGYRIMQAVDAISKRDGEAYDDYLSRVEADEIAKEVKIKDLADNMDWARLKYLPEETAYRLENKYRTALKRLT